MFTPIIFIIIDAHKANLRRMLDGYNNTFSHKRMNMLKNIFQKYSLDAKDNSTIDLLIKGAENTQKENDHFIPPEKSAKTLGTGFVIFE